MNRKKTIAFFILLVSFLWLLFFTSSPVNAQSYRSFRNELNQIIENTRWRLGPFRIFPTFRIGNIGYDSNVFYQRDEDDPSSDLRLTFSPEVKVHLIVRNTLILTLTESLEYVHYFKIKSERRFNNSLIPSFKLLFLNRFVISGSFSKQSRRWRATSEFNARRNVIHEFYNGSIFYETARGTSIGFSGSLNRITNEDIKSPDQPDSLLKTLDREEKKGQFEIYYRIFSRSTIFWSIDYTEYNFERREASTKNSYSYQTNIGVFFPLLGRIQGTASLGFKKLVPRSKEKKDFTGLIGNASLNFRGGKFRFQLGFYRDSPFSFSITNVYFIDTRVQTGVAYYFTFFLKLGYDYTIGKTAYPELMQVLYPDGSFQEIKRKDTYQTHTASLALRIFRTAGIGFRFTYWERDSNFIEKRDRIYYGVYLEYGF